MPKLYIMKGLPASGKTRYCREHLSHCVRVNRDSLRWMVYGSAWNPKREAEITDVQLGCIDQVLMFKHDAVIDDINLNPKILEKWVRKARMYPDTTAEIVDLTHIPPWQCVENDRKRPQNEQVGADVIWEKWYKYLAPSSYKGDDKLPPIIISDLDGTVRDNTWRNAYDLTGKCIDDPPRWEVIHAIRGIQVGNSPCFISFMSGMEYSEANWKATAEWLDRYFTNYTLTMRQTDDHRRDSVVKMEMFDKTVRGVPVIAVFDDRPQVIRECWVPLGLYDRIFSVGKPMLEF